MRIQSKFTIAAPGRDQGKMFFVTEMGARPGFDWAQRALFAIINSGVDLPDPGRLEQAGWAGVAIVGIQMLGRVPHPVAKPLLDELLACVQFVPEPSNPDVMRSLFESDIEESTTYFALQKFVLELHIGPFTAGVQSILGLTPTPTGTAV